MHGRRDRHFGLTGKAARRRTIARAGSLIVPVGSFAHLW